MIVRRRSFWRTLRYTSGDSAIKRALPFRLCPLLLFLNANEKELADVRVSWQSPARKDDDLLSLFTIAATWGSGNRTKPTLDSLKELQSDLRDDLALLSCGYLPDDESTEARAARLVQHLNNVVESVAWTIHEKRSKHYDKVGTEKDFLNQLSPLARGNWNLERRAMNARENLAVEKHPEVFGKLADLPFTDRYSLAETLTPKGEPTLRRGFYLILADIARGTLQKPRLCNESTCRQFFLHNDPREKFCSIECRESFHGLTASARVMRSRAKSKE